MEAFGVESLEEHTLLFDLLNVDQQDYITYGDFARLRFMLRSSHLFSFGEMSFFPPGGDKLPNPLGEISCHPPGGDKVPTPWGG